PLRRSPRWAVARVRRLVRMRQRAARPAGGIGATGPEDALAWQRRQTGAACCRHGVPRRGTSSPVRLLVSAASGDGDVAMNPATIEIVATVLFALAIVHTFSTKFFLRLAHRQPAHAGSWHLLGEVEVVFGFWALVLVLAIALVDGVGDATAYVDSRNYTEPMFVFAIMVIAGTRPI